MQAESWCRKRMNPGQIKERINPPQRLVLGNKILNREPIKQHTLRHLPRSHHRPASTLKSGAPVSDQPINRLLQLQPEGAVARKNVLELSAARDGIFLYALVPLIPRSS